MQAADVKKLKVNELKAELEAYGLPTTGKKEELIQRLSEHLELTAAALQGDDGQPASNAGTTTATAAKPATTTTKPAAATATTTTTTTTKTVKLTTATPSIATTTTATTKAATATTATAAASSVAKKSNGETAPDSEKANTELLSPEQRKELRAKRFGLGTVAVGDEAMRRRAERFGLPIDQQKKTPTKTAAAATTQPSNMFSLAIRQGMVDEEKLQKRNERFGSSTGDISAKLEVVSQEEARRKRAEKFGIVDEEQKKRARMERFGTPAADAKLEQRKKRFQVAAK